MAQDNTPYIASLRRALRCGRLTCPCRLPGAPLHCPAHAGSRPPTLSIDGPPHDPRFTCTRRCLHIAIAEALAQRGLAPPSHFFTEFGALEAGLRPLTTLTPHPVDWLWPGYLALGGLTVLAGFPGSGKTAVALDLAARATTGAPAPGSSARFPIFPVVVALLSGTPAATILPRLEAQHGDPTLVYLADPLPSDQNGARRATLEEDVSRIAHPVEVSNARMLIVDQVEALADVHGASLRRTFASLAAVARRTGAAVLAVCQNPAPTLPQAVAGMARRPISATCVLTIASLTNPPLGPESDRVLVPVKPSMTDGALALPFRFDRTTLVWDTPVSDVGLELLDQLPEPESSLARAWRLREAIDLLDAMLDDGPRPAAEVKRAALARRISRYQLFEARKFHGVRSVRVNTRGKGPGRGAWYWHLQYKGFHATLPAAPALGSLNHEPDNGLAA